MLPERRTGATLGDIVTGLNTLAHSQWVSLEHVFRASSDLQTVLDAVRIEANRRDVPYQSLIKVWLSEKVAKKTAA